MKNQLLKTISKDLYQRRWAIIGFCLGAFLFLLLYVSIFPSFQRESSKFNEVLESYPKALLEAFNIDQLNLNTLSGYVSAEHFSLVWPLMAIFFALSLSGQALAGEIEKGTMAMLLSLPLGRSKIYQSKYLAGMIAILLFVVISIFSLIPLASIFNLSVSVGNVAKIALLSTFFSMAIFSVGMLFSAIFSEKSRVYFITGGILLIMYTANIVSGLIQSMDKLKYISYFHYYQPDKAIVQGRLFISSFIVFGLTTVLLYFLSIYIFKNRDISV